MKKAIIVGGLALAAVIGIVVAVNIINAPAGDQTDPTKVSIRYVDNAQVEITSLEGVRIFIDVFKPSDIKIAPTTRDILLTTHFHYDHIDPGQKFINGFPGQKLTVSAGAIEFRDVKVTGIPSTHSSGEDFAETNGSNYIFLIELGNGLRIAHFGDIGQDDLTEKQLATLGRIDIAITQLDNSFSSMTPVNRKGFNLMDQVKPKMVIPTHTSQKANNFAVTVWKGMYSGRPRVAIGTEDLRNDTIFLLLGTAGAYEGKKRELPEFK